MCCGRTSLSLALCKDENAWRECRLIIWNCWMDKLRRAGPGVWRQRRKTVNAALRGRIVPFACRWRSSAACCFWSSRLMQRAARCSSEGLMQPRRCLEPVVDSLGLLFCCTARLLAQTVPRRRPARPAYDETSARLRYAHLLAHGILAVDDWRGRIERLRTRLWRCGHWDHSHHW